MEQSDSLTRLSGVAGVVGPILFIVIFVVFEFLTPGYSPLTQPISFLEDVPNGWIQQLNFLQCGTLIIIFAIGFRKAMGNVIRSRLRISTILLVLSGAGFVIASIFTPAYPIEHLIGFLLGTIPTIAAFVLIGREFLKGDSWHVYGIYSAGNGLVSLRLFLYFLSPAAFGFSGAVSQLFVVVLLAWFVVFGTRFLKS